MSGPNNLPIPEAAETGRDPLLKPTWAYVGHTNLEDFRAADWALLNSQRDAFLASTLAEHVLRILAVSEHDPTFG